MDYFFFFFVNFSFLFVIRLVASWRDFNVCVIGDEGEAGESQGASIRRTKRGTIITNHTDENSQVFIYKQERKKKKPNKQQKVLFITTRIDRVKLLRRFAALWFWFCQEFLLVWQQADFSSLVHSYFPTWASWVHLEEVRDRQTGAGLLHASYPKCVNNVLNYLFFS